MVTISEEECPACGLAGIEWLYGGERGETGPWQRCPSCHWTDEPGETTNSSDPRDAEIVKLLPCTCHPTEWDLKHGNHDRVCPAYRRLAVTALLTKRDEEITALREALEGVQALLEEGRTKVSETAARRFAKHAENLARAALTREPGDRE